VERVRHGSDRRQVLVQLTPVGRALIESVFPPHAAMIAEAMSNLDDAEMAQLDRLLRKLGLGPEGSLAGGFAPPHVSAETFDSERSVDKE